MARGALVLLVLAALPATLRAEPADLGAAVLGGIVTATSPIWAPHMLMGDRTSMDSRFPGCPYAWPDMGYAYLDRFDDKPWERQALPWYDAEYLKPWAVRLALDEGNDFNGLNRVNGRLTVDTSSRLGATTNWSWFARKLSCGCIESSVVGDLNVTARFAQHEWVQMYAGVGARLRTYGCDTQAGFNCLYGADVFPVRPVVLSALFEVGNLDDMLVVHARGTVGAALGRIEVFAGYDFLRIGTVNYQGPLVGVRLWF
jgi:hypothetical protein